MTSLGPKAKMKVNILNPRQDFSSSVTSSHIMGPILKIFRQQISPEHNFNKKRRPIQSIKNHPSPSHKVCINDLN